MPSRRIQLRTVVEDERPRVIGLDEPFGERLVTHFIEPSEHDHDVGERHITLSGKLDERRQP